MAYNNKYLYSINFSIGTLLVILLWQLMLLSVTIKSNSFFGWVIFGVLSAGMIVMLYLIAAKRLFPALKGEIALELNEEVLIDYIRNVTINWKDINDIKLTKGRSAATLIINLKWESDYGQQIAIPLRWVKGKDTDIYDTALAYFENDEVAE